MRKVLEVCWDIKSDCLVISLESLACIATSIDLTKGNIVSLVGKFYDPLGFSTPIVVHFKMYF